MLKIKADQVDRELVQAIAAEYITTKFHELKGDYDSIVVRLDTLTSKLERVEKQVVGNEDLIKHVEEQKGEVNKIRKEVTSRLETYENERIGLLEHRLADLEDHVGI